MPNTCRTWNHKKLNIQLNGIEITDVNGDVSVEAGSDFWAFTEGQNGCVERSLLGNSMVKMTIPMMATSPQLDLIETLNQADQLTGDGPYVFSSVKTDSNYKLVGQATILSIEHPKRSKQAQARNVVLQIVAEAEWLGA